MSPIPQITKELKANVDLKYKQGSEKYFKEEIRILGVRTPVVRQIGKKYFPKINPQAGGKKEIFSLCEELLNLDKNEYSTIAFQWAHNLEKDYQPSDFKTFENWLKKYVDNWAKCDDFCTHSFGSLIYQYPELLPKVFVWTNSKNRWLRRASAVTLIHHCHKKDKTVLKNIFQTAEKLLLDEDDLVQKSYGWMLKESSNNWQPEVFEFVMKHKNNMPRTALRYAVEKMPKDLKTKAMSK